MNKTELLDEEGLKAIEKIHRERLSELHLEFRPNPERGNQSSLFCLECQMFLEPSRIQPDPKDMLLILVCPGSCCRSFEVDKPRRKGGMRFENNAEDLDLAVS